LVREINESKAHGLPKVAANLGEPKIVAYSKLETNAQGQSFEVLDTDRLMAVSIRIGLMKSCQLLT
jgi:hypothetical protein